MEKIPEEYYKKAVDVWKKENPDKKYLDIPTTTIIDLEGIGTINLGNYISSIRKIRKAMLEGKRYNRHKDLTEEEISYWTEQGMIWDYNRWSEENYRKAVEAWKKENPHQKYLNIPRDEIIELNGIGFIALGHHIDRIRQIRNSMLEGKKYGKNKNLTEEEISYWTEQGMIWDKLKWLEEKYRKAAEIWKKENPNKKYLDISERTVVELEDVGPINLGHYIVKMRQNKKEMLKDKRHDDEIDLTDEKIIYWTNQGMIWDYEKWTEENYRKAAKIWKKENLKQKYLDIPTKTVIELEDIGSIDLGRYIIRLRQIRKAMLKGKHYGHSKDLTEEEISYWTEQGMIWDYDEYKKNKKSSDSNSVKGKSTLEKYTELFDGDSEKAVLVVNCLKDLKERRKQKKKQEYSIDNILKEFNVDLETLKKYLNRVKTNKRSSKSSPLEYQTISLKKFCANHGYNYDVIYRAICLHEFCENDSLEQLINRSITTYQRKGQKEPATWVYEKYGTLVKHILLYLKLDASRILSDMSKYTISLEEAIRHTIFVQTKKSKEQDYLEEVYNYLIEEIDSNKSEDKMMEDIILKYQQLMQEYHFTKEEHETVITSFERYLYTIKEYQKTDVGLETDFNRKLDKIKDYRLEEEDIMESFFIPLEFDHKVLLGRKSELYKRRQLLRQHIIDWDLYTEEEKEEIKKNHHFTEEEMNMIERIRKDIDTTIVKAKIFH